MIRCVCFGETGILSQSKAFSQTIDDVCAFGSVKKCLSNSANIGIETFIDHSSMDIKNYKRAVTVMLHISMSLNRMYSIYFDTMKLFSLFVVVGFSSSKFIPKYDCFVVGWLGKIACCFSQPRVCLRLTKDTERPVSF